MGEWWRSSWRTSNIYNNICQFILSITITSREHHDVSNILFRVTTNVNINAGYCDRSRVHRRAAWNVVAVAHGPINFTHIMMTSSNGNIFHVTAPLCGEFTGDRCSPHKGQCRGAFMFSMIYAWINGWVNNRKAGDLRRHRAKLWRHWNVLEDCFADVTIKPSAFYGLNCNWLCEK